MSDAHHDDWFQHSAEGRRTGAHGQINAPFIIGFMVMVIVITSLLFIILGYVGREVAAEKGDKFENRTDIIAREVQEAKTAGAANSKAIRAGSISRPAPSGSRSITPRERSFRCTSKTVRTDRFRDRRIESAMIPPSDLPVQHLAACAGAGCGCSCLCRFTRPVVARPVRW